MASGKELRRRINSVKNTQQITKAMKMVSAAKLRRAQDAIVQARPYAIALRDAAQLLSENPEVQDSHPLLARRKVKRVNTILITSDRGLCGAFNSNLQKRAERLYRQEAANYESYVFTCIGKRGYEYLKLRKVPVVKFYEDTLKKVSFPRATAIAEEIMSGFLNGEFDEIRIIFAEFKSAITQVVRVDTVLPVQITASENKNAADAEANSKDLSFEPSRQDILDTLLPRYVHTSVFRALLESLASEHGARMAAMDNATRNAGEVIRKLRLVYNNVRQANITKELLEITSGAEAL